MRSITKMLRGLMIAILSTFVFIMAGHAQVPVFQEGFESGALPAGWTQTNVSGTTNWVFNAVGGYSSQPATTHSGSYNARLYYAGYGVKTEITTPVINLSGYSGATLTFWHAQVVWAGDQDSLVVFYRPNNTTNWKRLAIYQSSVASWTQRTITLPNTSATYQLKFRGCAEYGYGACLDDIAVTATLAPPPPVTVTIGTGTTSVSYPYYTYWMDGRTNIVYTAADIIAAGGAGGQISSLGFNVVSVGSPVMNGFNIRLQNSSTSTLTGFVNSGWTTCYSGTYTPAGTGWQIITLQTPFIWDGTSNLLIEICFDNTSWSSSSNVYASSAAGRTWEQHADNAAGCSFAAGAVQANRPNLRMTITPFVGNLTGVVKNAFNNNPIAGAQVVCGTKNATTNASGQYTILQVPIGNYNVQCTATGFLPATSPASITNGNTTTLNFNLEPLPAYLTGIVTNASTGAPIVGAAVTVSGKTTYSIEGGLYNLNVYPLGIFPITASKPGFEAYNTSPTTFNFQQGVTITHDIAMHEAANPPGPVTAVLNGTQTAVNISWVAPTGSYEIIYDDGVAENWTVWAQAGNMNAVKFTPLGSPVTLTGCRINIGQQNNYPAGGNPIGETFELAIYDATGPNGTPGSPIGDPVEVTAANYGWNYFDLPPTTISAANFYIVMIQMGVPPDAVGLAVDESSPMMRSYSRYVSGGAPWIPASGDFMIRAIVSGSGGPLDLDLGKSGFVQGQPIEGAIYNHTPVMASGTEGTGQYLPVSQDPTDVITGYQVWRLHQGEENNQAVWVSLGVVTTLSTIDNSWPTLPNGAYRWAVKTRYTGNRFSEPRFSNVLGKNWTANVTFNVTLSCDNAPGEGAVVTLTNTMTPDTTYSAEVPASGTLVFNNVWKGNYDIVVSKFIYDDYMLNDDIMADKTYDVYMLQWRIPPTGLTVDPKTLFCQWNKPSAVFVLFEEKWASGNFTANQWVVNGGNWAVSTTAGNPAPSAQFNWSPSVTNYSQDITSKEFTGIGASDFKLNYDIYLSNYGTTNENKMAVELWNGTQWVLLEEYTNLNGSIPWTSEAVDISAYTDITFKIRFRAHGTDSYDINNWNIDNIMIVAKESEGLEQCIIGYNFYLDNVVSGFTTDTTYTIPGNQVEYGHYYIAGVAAIYGSGYSEKDTERFRSTFLYPPLNLQGEGIQEYAYLTWEKPQTVGDFLDAIPRTNTPNPTVEYSPMVTQYTGGAPSDAIWDIMFYFNAHAASEPGIETDGQYIFTAKWNAAGNFSKYENVGGTWTWIEDFTVSGAGAIRDMAYDGDYFYGGAASTTIYKMDLINKVLIGTISTTVNVRHIAYTPAQPGFYCGDWATMALINMTGGTPVTNITGLGLSSMYGSAYDNVSPGNPYLWIFDQGGAGVDIHQMSCATNTLTGVMHSAADIPGFSAGIAGGLCADNGNLVPNKFILVGSTQQTPNLIFAYEISEGGGGGGQTPPGLIGYNIYRDGGPAPLVYIDDQNILEYYDGPLDPGTYLYDISAVYDLTPYGFPGQTDESMWEGTVTVEIIYGYPLPFMEPWTSANFTYNDWTFAPDQGNWQVTTAYGNPAPSAMFNWMPEQNDYSFALVSPTINAGPWTCADIWLDFDYKLDDRNNTGAEKLIVDVYYNGFWHNKAEYVSNGDLNWTSEHIDISGVSGKAFKVRFVAEGENSNDIISWMVDNVHAYGICHPPTDLEADWTGTGASPIEVTLSWTPPVCGGGGGGTTITYIFDDGSAENGWAINPGYSSWLGSEFPVTDAGMLQTFDLYWMANAAAGPYSLTIDVFDASQNLVGTSSSFLSVGDDWVTVNANDIPFAGTFYAMVHWDMLGGNTNWLGLDENGPQSGMDLEWYYDGTAWDKLSNMGYNGGNFLIRATAMVGDNVVTFVPGVPTPLNQPAYAGSTSMFSAANRAVDTRNYAQTTITDNADSSQIVGYNIYRSIDGDPFVMVNSTPVNATSYTDEDVPMATTGYEYYVTTMFNDSQTGLFLCESSESNHVDLGVGINEPANNAISIFPNPASDIVNVKSSSSIKKVELLNYVGQAVFSRNTDTRLMQISVADLEAGVYFVKVTTDNGITTSKITVTK